MPDSQGGAIVDSGLALGVIALVLTVAMVVGPVPLYLGLMPFLVGILVAIVCVALGLILSAVALIRRRGRSVVMPVSALVVNVLALAAVIAAAIVFLGKDEPTYDEAMLQLVRESGVVVQRISPARPALLALPSGYYEGPLDQRPRIPLVLSLDWMFSG